MCCYVIIGGEGKKLNIKTPGPKFWEVGGTWSWVNLWFGREGGHGVGKFWT